MDPTELELRTAARNARGTARNVLQDYLEEHGRLKEMPDVLLLPFQANLVRKDEAGPDSNYQMYKALRFWNNWVISIQASEYHYSRPRKSHLRAAAYTHFELALFDPANPKEFADPALHLELVPLGLNEYWDGGVMGNGNRKSE